MITLIAALDENNCIGKENTIPWHLPRDFAHFKETTLGHPVIMGRRTFESLGKPLPGRTNIVLTSEEAVPGCEVAHSLEEAFAMAESEDSDVFVCGGASVYEQALPYAGRLILTHVDTVVPDGDAFFPVVNTDEWVVKNERMIPEDEKNTHSMTIVVYERG